MKYISRTDFVLSNLARHLPETGGSILDIGFIGDDGGAHVHKAILDRFPDQHVTGIDINPAIQNFSDSDTRHYQQHSIFDVGNNEAFRSAFDSVILCRECR